MSILLLSGTILSGRRYVLGSLLGAAFLVLTPRLLQFALTSTLDRQWAAFPLANIGYAIIIIIVSLILFPKARGILHTGSEADS